MALKNYVGTLLGNSLLGSVDVSGKRPDKSNCIYIVRDYYVPVGYRGYILDTGISSEYAKNIYERCNASILFDINKPIELKDYDIIEINNQGIARQIYQCDSIDNVLFVTNRCNSNCIMCPDSDNARRNGSLNRIDYLLELARLIPDKKQFLTITGGEPTLIKYDLFKLLEYCQEKFQLSEFQMLSNGRSFADDSYRERFIGSVPKNFFLGVPLYSADSETHNSITRAHNGFEQTVYALTELQKTINIEIRVVVMNNNYKELPRLSQFIATMLPMIKVVSFMGLELLGNASIARDDLWIDYDKAIPYIEHSLNILIDNGIPGRIFNFPLCSMPPRLWANSVQSITDYKIRFKEACDECVVKKYCGGFFYSTINYPGVKVFPIKTW